ncbi:MAG: N-acetylmuramoyl-L-alanine amidase [Clostridia bacterium]|nr:N-acetylmuramoyl-L-alanine amidase [Clostridia bacterium]
MRSLKKVIILMMVLMIAATACAESGWSWIEEPIPANNLRLSDIAIGIDPGHQAHGNSQHERVSPNSSETKPKVASGTAGVTTGVAEYVVDLQISLLLRDALIAEGATVYMTRETNDVDISNMERALMMNELGADLVLRIHCNGSTNHSTKGIGLYVNATGDIAAPSYAAAQMILPRMTEATGARADGIFRRDTYTGLNWSTVPCILVETGYMSNPEEDVKLNDPAYQALLVEGIVAGICDYFER